MQITKFSDYCLRILIFLAVEPSGKQTTKTVAERFGISLDHVAKAAKWLTRFGYIESTRGKGGGISLLRPPHSIKLGELVSRTEGNKEIVQCHRAGGGTCTIYGACALPAIFGDAQKSFFETLDRYTLEDAIRNQAPLKRILGAK